MPRMKPFLAALLVAGGVAFGYALKPAPGAGETLQVEVGIDFGPVARSSIRKTLRLPKGATALSATQAAATVKLGLACCEPQDVDGIDGVVNWGNGKVYFFRTWGGIPESLQVFA